MEAENEPLHPSVEPDAESVIDEFVELFNARDWDAVAELLHENADSDSFDAADPEELLRALDDLTLEYPALLLTRGELEDEPVAVAWLPDFETREWSKVGYFTFALEDDPGGDFPLIEHLEYEEAPHDDDRLLAEEPDEEDLPEWFDWRAWDEGQPSDED